MASSISDSASRLGLGTPGAKRQSKSMLHTFKASHFLEEDGHRTILSVRESSTVGETFTLLSANRILSVPVRKISGPQRGYYAFVDMLDILCHFLNIFGEDFKTNPAWMDHEESALETYAKKRLAFLETPVSEIANLSGRNKFYPIQEDAPMRAVIDLFATHTVHRIPIVNATGDVVNVVSQSRMVKFLADHSDKIKDFFPVETIGELKLGYRPVISVRTTDRAIHAFTVIREQNVSGVGVVSPDGQLVGNISVSDLRVIQGSERYMDKLMLSVEDYLKLAHAGRPSTFPQGPLSVPPSFNLEEVFVKFSNVPVHRFFIMEETGEVRGLVSLGDILGALLVKNF